VIQCSLVKHISDNSRTAPVRCFSPDSPRFVRWKTPDKRKVLFFNCPDL